MSVRALVLPATPLLVPGAAGAANPLAATRRAVLDALDGVIVLDGTAEGGRRPTVRWGVLAPAPRTRHGARRASLAAAGIADRWVPTLPTGGPGPHAGVPASVALWAVAATAGGAAVRDAVVVEAADDLDEASRAAALDLLARADVVVAAGGLHADGPTGTTGLAPGPASLLQAIADRGGWGSTTTRIVEHGPHLPEAYDVVVWTDAQSSANQPTPASRSANRTVRPTSTTGT